MKICKMNFYAFCLCTILAMACTPDEEKSSSTEIPDIEVPGVPDKPDLPDNPDPDIPDEDGGSSGKPDSGGGDVVPDEPGDYTEEEKVIERRDFTKEINLSAYRMIDADGIPIDHPLGMAGWNYIKEEAGYRLTSFMADVNNDHDHWLITEGFYIPHTSAKMLLTWMMQCDYAPESYEVYLYASPSSSPFPDKEDFTERIYAGIEQPSRDGTKVDYMLEGYEGQTIYLAFRHHTSGKSKWALTLKNLTLSTFPYDKQDLVADKFWLTYPEFLYDASNVSTGVVYFLGLNLRVSVAIKNLGVGLRGETLSATYEYDGKKVTEEIPHVYLAHGETYVYVFKEPLLTQAGDDPVRPVSVTVKPLPGEVRVKKNSRYIEVSHLSGDPHYRVLFEKYSWLGCGPCGFMFNAFEEIDQEFPGRMVGVVTMRDPGLFPATEAGGAHKTMIQQISGVWGTPAVCYDRKEGVNGNINSLKTVMMNGGFASRMFPPFAIDVTHEFSADNTLMYAHVKATCLLDMEDVDFRLTALFLEDDIKEYPEQMNHPNAIHNHIVRGMVEDSWRYGLEGIIPASVKAGEVYEHTFEYAVPTKIGKHTVGTSQLYAVGLIVKDNGQVINCNKSTRTASSY